MSEYYVAPKLAHDIAILLANEFGGKKIEDVFHIGFECLSFTVANFINSLINEGHDEKKEELVNDFCRITKILLKTQIMKFVPIGGVQ